MSDRELAVEALDRLRAIQERAASDSAIAHHRHTAIEHVEALVAELENATHPEPPDEAAETPDEWDDEAWEDKLDSAREKAAIAPSKGTLTTKTINGREYYYLQWREGEKVTSQYVAPVDPA